ncbi:MAG: hypothetical protein KKB70_08360 [Proteobacteria bacterium]|nr:hypothetical protein [Pseudomonadota bacterium]
MKATALLHTLILAIALTFPVLTEAASVPKINPARVFTKFEVVRANENQFKVVTFEIPKNHVLIDIKIFPIGNYTQGDDLFNESSKVGWRITNIDKLSEYNSKVHPKTSFTVECWAHEDAETDPFIELKVIYKFYYLGEVGKQQFETVISTTFKKVHSIPVHQSAESAWNAHKANPLDNQVIEKILNDDEDCTWGAYPSCSDCLLIRKKDKKTRYEYYFNSKQSDAICW